MQHHGLGHLPQPDNFTTCGRLGIEVNQYNNPIECYADETIDDMREEKVIVDHPEMAEKILKGNTQVRLSAPGTSKDAPQVTMTGRQTLGWECS